MSALDVTMNLALLSAILIRLRQMRRESVHIKKSFSRLSYVLCGATAISIPIMVLEVAFEIPTASHWKGFEAYPLSLTSAFSTQASLNSPLGGSWSVTFSPIVSPLYAFGMLPVLNARDDWHRVNLTSGSHQTRRTQFTFTDQFPSLIEERNSRSTVARSRTATEQTTEDRERGLDERETQSDLRERQNQRRTSEGGENSEVQSSEYGIQGE